MTQYLLFSEELFSDTRLSQQQTGGVLKYADDRLAGVQRSSRKKKPLKSLISPSVQSPTPHVTTTPKPPKIVTEITKNHKKRTFFLRFLQSDLSKCATFEPSTLSEVEGQMHPKPTHLRQIEMTSPGDCLHCPF